MSNVTTPAITADQVALFLQFQAFMAAQSPSAPAVVAPEPKAVEPKAPKAKKDRVLNRTTRKAFVKAHPWAAGLSAIQIAEAALSEPKEFPLVDGWTISTARANRALMGEWS